MQILVQSGIFFLNSVNLYALHSVDMHIFLRIAQFIALKYQMYCIALLQEFVHTSSNIFHEVHIHPEGLSNITSSIFAGNLYTSIPRILSIYLHLELCIYDVHC